MDVFSGVRANCTSEGQQVTDVIFNLSNVPHEYTYFSNASTSNGSDWWVFYMNITLNYSGEYRLYTVCYNNNSDNFTTLTNWTIPWGTLVANLTNPTSSTNVQRNELFNFSANISCIGGECGNINAAAQALVWWNTSWSYRNPINITEQSNTNLTNYQVNLSIST